MNALDRLDKVDDGWKTVHLRQAATTLDNASEELWVARSYSEPGSPERDEIEQLRLEIATLERRRQLLYQRTL